MSKNNNFDVLSILQEHGAMLKGHFQLPNGLHSENYIQTFLVTQYPNLLNKISQAMSDLFDKTDVNVVLAPTAKISVIAQEIARIKKGRAVFAEEHDGVMKIKPELAPKKGDKVLVVDDVTATGKLISNAIAVARSYDAEVVGVVSIVDRSVGDLCLQVPIRALMSFPLETYEEKDCPLCKKKIPLQLYRKF